MCSSEQYKAAAEAEKIVSVLLSEMLVMSQNLFAAGESPSTQSLARP